MEIHSPVERRCRCWADPGSMGEAAAITVFHGKRRFTLPARDRGSRQRRRWCAIARRRRLRPPCRRLRSACRPPRRRRCIRRSVLDADAVAARRLRDARDGYRVGADRGPPGVCSDRSCTDVKVGRNFEPRCARRWAPTTRPSQRNRSRRGGGASSAFPETELIRRRYVERATLRGMARTPRRNHADIWARRSAARTARPRRLLQVRRRMGDRHAAAAGDRRRAISPSAVGCACHRLSRQSRHTWPDHIIDVPAGAACIKENIADWR